MYYYLYHYPTHPPYPVILRTYPPVNVKIFESSVQSFRILMAQGSKLLDRLGDSVFAAKIMSAAQQGKKAEVDKLVKSIGLSIPVITNYTPSGVIFVLRTLANQQSPESCCTLTISMKWGF